MTDKNKPKFIKLGEFVRNFPLTEKEATRLTKLLKEKDKFLMEIFKRYGSSAIDDEMKNLINRFRKELGLKGFRIEGKVIINRLINRVRAKFGQDVREFEVYEKFYIKTFINYLDAELLSLQKLLRKEEIELSEDKQLGSYEIINKMLNLKHKYDVSVDDVRKLYKYWWFPRLSKEQEEELLKDDPFEIINKKQFELEEKLVGFEGKIENLLDKSKNSNPIPKDIEKKLDEIKNIKNKSVEIESKIEELLRKQEKNEENLNENKKGLGNVLKTLNAKSNKVEKLSNELKSGLERDKKEVDKKLKDNYDSVHSTLRSIVENENRKLAGISIKDSFIPKLNCKREDIKQEEIFINAWTTYANSQYQLNLTRYEAVIAHICFKSLPVCIVHSYSLLESWIKASGFEKLSFVDCASPLWVKTANWFGLFSHLDNPNSRFKIGILKDYDVAMMCAYLIPQINRWQMNGKLKNLRLFLFETQNTGDRISNEYIYHFAPKLTKSALRIGTLKKDFSKKELFDTTKALPKVTGKSLLEWVKVPLELQFRNELLTIPKNTLKVLIPEGILLNFNNVFVNLKEYLTEKSAMETSLELCVRPFVDVIYGSENYQKVKEQLRGYYVKK